MRFHQRLCAAFTVSVYGITLVLFWFADLDDHYASLTRSSFKHAKRKAARPTQFANLSIAYLKTPKHISCRLPFNKSENVTRPVSVFIFTRPTEVENRGLIRGSWAKPSIDLISFTFVIGLPNRKRDKMRIQAEHEKYGDILQLNLEEDYRGLPWKTFGTLSYAAENCANGSLILKADGDCIIMQSGIESFRKSTQLDLDNRVIYGKRMDRSKIDRDPTSKLYVSFDDYSKPKFPQFVAGIGYFLTVAAVRPIVNEARSYNKFIPLEDVLFTGILPARLNIKRKNHYGFRKKWAIPESCNNYLILQHSYSRRTKDLAWVWEDTMNSRKNCTQFKKMPTIQDVSIRIIKRKHGKHAIALGPAKPLSSKKDILLDPTY